MQVTTANLRPGGIGRSPLSNSETYERFASRISSTTGIGTSSLYFLK
jgi:hypothetical protein